MIERLAEAAKRLEALEPLNPAISAMAVTVPRSPPTSLGPCVELLTAAALTLITLIVAHHPIIVAYSLPLVPPRGVL